MGNLLKSAAFFAVVLTAGVTRTQEVKLVPLQILGSPEKPANAVEHSTKPIQALSVAGHWVALDKKNPIVGFSISEITCVKAGAWGNSEAYCHENAVSVIPNVGFRVMPDHNEYDIISWRADGLTARYIGGVCKIAHTLEIDFKTGEVLTTDSPTKVGDEICQFEQASYQLMDGESFSVDVKK